MPRFKQVISFQFLVFLCLCQSLAAQKFAHFFLREFAPRTKVVEDVFEVNEFYRLKLYPDHKIDYEEAAEFFETNESRGIFPETDLKLKYYYDTKARSHEKIFVILFGTLWDPDTLNLLRTMTRLYETFSKEQLNQKSVIRQFNRWFKKKTKTGFEREVLIEGRQLEIEEWQKIESADQGSRLFHPDNLFVLVNQIYSVLKDVPYRPDVAFSFVAVSADDADAQEILKDEDIPFSFLNDFDASKTNMYVKVRVPALLIVNHRGDIAYQGEVLGYYEVKSIIDRLMVGIFEHRGQQVKDYYHKIRKERYLRKREKELKEKARQAAKAGK